MSKVLAPTIPDLITEGSAIRDRMEADKKRLAEINALLIEAGGTHEHGGHKVQVIAPAPSIGFPKTKEDQDKARDLCGEAFPKLFERETVYSPVKAIKEVAAALLPKGAFNKLLALCSVEKTPYVKWS